MTTNNYISPTKFCYNTSFTLPKQSPRSRSVLQDVSRFLELFWKDNPKDLDPSSRFLGLFWKEKLHLITEEIWYSYKLRETWGGGGWECVQGGGCGQGGGMWAGGEND